MTANDIYPLVQSQPFELSTTEEARVDLTLKKPVPVSLTKLCGRVSSCAHVAIRKATVKVLTLAYDPILHTLTDDDGQYCFENILPPGVYRVTAAASGYLTPKTKKIVLKEGSSQYANFRLQSDPMRHKSTVYGLTLDFDTKKPLCNTLIILYDVCGKPAEITVSNEYGQYLFSAITPGQYVLTANKNGYLIKSISVTAVKDSVIQCDVFLDKAPLTASGTVSGLIKCGSQTAADAVVGLYRLSGCGEELVGISKTNSEGLYLFTNVDSGLYQVKSKSEKGEAYTEEFQVQ